MSAAFAREPDGQRLVAKRVLRERRRLQGNIKELEVSIMISMIDHELCAIYAIHQQTAQMRSMLPGAKSLEQSKATLRMKSQSCMIVGPDGQVE